jgi:outer membrane biogenesis lipoprotein LolB
VHAIRTLLPVLAAILLLGPAAGGHAPPPKDAAAAPKLDDTEWTGLDDQAVTTIRFEKDGVLAYIYNGHSYRNGTWKQDGKNLYFEMNDKYRECKATVTGDTIEGDSWNVTDKKWTTTLYRYRKPN